MVFHHGRNIGPTVMILAALAVIGLFPLPVTGKEAATVKKTAEKAVAVDSQTQKAVEAWVDEEAQLQSEIEKMTKDLKHVRWKRQKVAVYRKNLDLEIEALKQQATEMEKINLELLPLLEQALEQLKATVAAAPPFDMPTSDRLVKAETALNRFDTSLLEKARAVFDVLAQEADMGHGVEVRQAELELDGKFRQFKLLRIGRIELYALSLDSQKAYRWSADQKRFLPVEDGVRAIQETIEMAEAIRVVALSRLPVGPAFQTGNNGGSNFEAP